MITDIVATALVPIIVALAFVVTVSALVAMGVSTRHRRARLPEAPPQLAEEPPVELRPRLSDRLGAARNLISGYLRTIASRNGVDNNTWDALEEALIRADVGVVTTSAVLGELRDQASVGRIRSSGALLDALARDLSSRLSIGDRSLHLKAGVPNVWLFVGVNGVGKTTTIGKIGHLQQAEGRSVVIAGADTFRAAAGEQLEVWARRIGADVVRGAEGGDPGAVVFDAVQEAAARNADLVLADTAGRLHTKVNLMEELRKVRRVAERPPGKLSEVLLVLDATVGQNGLAQARQFTEAVGVTGVVLTKLDGTAKGGIVLAIREQLGLPIKLVGVGEGVEDLLAFDPDEFVDALLR